MFYAIKNGGHRRYFRVNSDFKVFKREISAILKRHRCHSNGRYKTDFKKFYTLYNS